MTLSLTEPIVAIDPSRGSSPSSSDSRPGHHSPDTIGQAAGLDPAATHTNEDDAPMKILLVEDDERLSRSLARLLEQDRHNVEVAGDGETGLEIALGENGIDVVVLDIGLPDISGLEVARRIRRDRRDLAILMLTARDTVGDRVTGLDTGADDYVVKPFAYDELAARLRALARRADKATRLAEPKLTAGPIVLDEATRTVTVGDGRVDLSPREFSLLESLLRHPGQALSRDQLLDQAWPFGVAVTPNAVDAYIHYLRTKLGREGDRIETVRGVGYRLNDA
jgi:DNA-binding response OmpR family regulator